MNLQRLSTLSASAVIAAALLAGCGGENAAVSVSNAATSTPRYAQLMSINFSGTGLDQGVEVQVEGSCSNLTKSAASSATSLTYTCLVGSVGALIARAVDSADGKVYASVRANVPLPQITFSVSDGTRTGTFVMELDALAAPFSVQRFMGYLADGYYVDTLFHRVSPTSAILGGGFTSSTEGIISAKIADRPNLALENTGLKNLRGTVALYRTGGRDSANAMFFINTVDNPRFDAGSAENPDGYAVFGKVVQGLDIVDEVAKVPVRPDLNLGVNDVPVTAVRIRAAIQTR